VSRPKQFDPEVAVDRAMHLFWRRGYLATSPQDLVDELGIGKGSLYATFGSKRDLFGLALDRYRKAQGDTLTEIIDRPGPVRQRLRAALQLIVDASADDPDRRGCLAVNTAAELAGVDVEATEDVRRMFEHNHVHLLAVITAGQQSGEVRDDIPASALAAHLLTTGVGLQLLVKTARDPRSLSTVVDAAIAALAPPS
jgi:TetR/AcrR family transcriptional regulator, transcriptional repressor for nem operon